MMPGWEVKRKGQVFRMGRSEDLLRMAVIGQIHATDRVRTVGETEWRLAGDVEEVASALEQDPWSAWESLGGQSPKALWNACTELVGAEEGPEAYPNDYDTLESRAEDLLKDSGTSDTSEVSETDPVVLEEQDFSAPVLPRFDEETTITRPIPRPPPPPKATPPESERLEPVSTPQEQTKPDVQQGGGEIIAFPSAGGQRRGSAGVAAALDIPDFAEFEERMARPQVRPPRRAFPWVLGTVGMVGILAMMMVNAHVRSTAMWVSPRATTPNSTEATDKGVVKPAEETERVEVVSTVDSETPYALRAASHDLRDRLSPGVIDMKGRVDDLSTALLVELSRMDLGPVKVQAPVLAWGGARNDMPEAVDIHVLLQSRDELEWEIGAVGLVIGKYVQSYDLEVERLQLSLQAEDGTLKRIQIDPDLTRQFYRNRVDLLGFLQGL
ncbi:MAG: hypothetical protein VX519_05240 [Myxococcota bacterium]|nr:hypothetical protein [Myxococcota bacterium]